MYQPSMLYKNQKTVGKMVLRNIASFPSLMGRVTNEIMDDDFCFILTVFLTGLDKHWITRGIPLHLVTTATFDGSAKRKTKMTIS